MREGISCGDVECCVARRSRQPTAPAASRRSAKLALPRSPHGIETSVLARRELAELVVGLLGEFEDVVGDGHGVVVVVKDGEKVVRVDAGAWRVGDAKGATAVAAGWGKSVDVEVTLALVVWSRRCKIQRVIEYERTPDRERLRVLTLDDHDLALDECDSNGTVAQHGGMG